MSFRTRRFSLQVPMGTEPSGSGKIKVDEHYPSELDEPPPFDVRKIENIRANVKFDTLYQVTKLLGDGKFGKVYCVIEKATGHEFAAKFIKIRKEADRAEVEREVSILTQLRHPRIAQIYDAFYTTTNDVVLIMEIVRGGELFDRVAEESYELSELAVVMIVCQLCEAIDYIHKQNILHLDVKPENIMCVSLTGNRIKLIDFGLARHYDGKQELKYMAGTPEFAAPEVIKFEKLDYHTDMWSIGVITYILLSGYSPFLGDTLGDTYCNVEKGVWEFTEEFDTVSAEAKDFVEKLLIYDQSKRMLPHECLNHPWIAKHRQKAACNAVLEKPLNAPPLDKEQYMKYTRRRKLRSLIIYVKFVIEMNRLRQKLSVNAVKFFDPLIKKTQTDEQRVTDVCNSTAPSTSASSVLAKVIEMKRKGSEASHLSQIKEENGSPEKKPEKKMSTTSVDKPKKKKKIVHESVKPATPEIAITNVQIEASEKAESENGKIIEKKLALPEKRKESTKSESDLINKKKKEKISKAVKESEVLKSITPKKSTESEKSSVLKNIEIGSDKNSVEKEKKSVTSENIIEKPKVEPKLVKAKTESGDSTKENQQEVKKPARQGALRKRDKSIENVLNSAPVPTTLSKQGSTTSSLTHTLVETVKPNGEIAKSEKLIVKKKSLKLKSDDVKSIDEKAPVKTVEQHEPLPKITTSIVHLEKSDRDKIRKRLSEKGKDTPERKPVTKMTLTEDKKETTTVQTTTSCKRTTKSSEKKLEHNSDGKSVELTHKKNSQHDDCKVSQITTKKEETPAMEAPKTIVNKKVVKQALVKSTSEKEKTTKDGENTEKTLKKTDKDSKIVSIEEKQLVNGDKVDHTKVTGTKTVTNKLEVEEMPRKSSLKKTTEVLKKVDITKNDKIGTIKSKDKTSVKITPDSGSETSSNKSVRINLSSESSLKSSVKSNSSKMSTRDSSEERKKVRFAGETESEASSSVAELKPSPGPLFGPGLQKMRSESSLHNRAPNSNNTAFLNRVGSIHVDIDDYRTSNEFEYSNLKDVLARRISEGYADFDKRPRKPVTIPQTYSVEARRKLFESRLQN
ncbi:unnamed protein product [Caenorhabditis angaria]|uniref:Protein kinase domain-containing protein n=1 Tax=Caenorhabditis angaria TaxID=860376 RepID=A0A9P1J0F9_9PELO|nr:unnamed protein product [Caenorhabditis angaria]